MDILNTNAVYYTKAKRYITDAVDGGRRIKDDPTIDNVTKDENGDYITGEAKDSSWCSGESAGLCFDLPTEA